MKHKGTAVLGMEETVNITYMKHKGTAVLGVEETGY